MRIKIFIGLLAFGITVSGFSQTNLNNFKYVIVPKKFEFLKEPNQYRLNELTEFLFNKYGFKALMEGSSYPDDLLKNRCLGLESDVKEDSGLFKTKLTVELKDCNDQTVFTSQVGESREKEYAKAYNEALREAFKTLEQENYHYVPMASASAISENSTENDHAKAAQEIKQLKEELQSLKAKKTLSQERQDPPKEAQETVDKEVQETAASVENPTNVLYAQPIANGFQLVDSSPKVVYKIIKTSLDHVFLVEGLNGTLINKDGQWVIEYYENGSLKQKPLNIKF